MNGSVKCINTHSTAILTGRRFLLKPAVPWGGFFFGVNMKRILTAIAALLALTTAALAAGTIPFSLSQQFDERGKPLSGCKLYTIQAGTVSTPQNAYFDTGLTNPLSNPITCDASGRLPQFFLSDGLVKVRLTDKNGITQIDADNILVIGPSSGGGGGGGGQVDPTTIAKTGDIKYRYSADADDGWVRANGRTIGSASSGATERANSDTQALFVHLWGTNSGLVVSGGRGASAAADWGANKTIALPDARGRAFAGLDDMGNTASGRLSSTYFGATPTALGAAGGDQSTSLAAGNIPPHTHSGTTGSMNRNATHTHEVGGGRYGGTSIGAFNGGSSFSLPSGGDLVSLYSANTDHEHAFTTNSGNGLSGTAFSRVMPTILVTTYIKL